MRQSPATFRAYLDEIYEFNLGRNRRLLLQLHEIVRFLNSAGITPLLLKGGAALATDLFPDPGMRFMWDLDLLVPEGTLPRSVAALESAGYVVPERFTTGGSSLVGAAIHHHAPLVRPGAPASVELHRQVLSAGGPLLEAAAVWRESRPLVGNRLPGVTAAVMSPTDELIYCFGHSELAHRHHHFAQIDERQLHHLAHIYSRYQDEIDWGRLEALQQHPRFGPVFMAYAHLAKVLFHVNLPGFSEGSPDAHRHYRKAISSRSGWRRQGHRIRMLLSEMAWAFRGERLRLVYSQEGVPTNRLRIRHLTLLLGRYRRLEAWRRRLRGLSPL